VLTAVFGVIVLLMIFLFYKEFMVLSFDPILAATYGCFQHAEQSAADTYGADGLGGHADRGVALMVAML